MPSETKTLLISHYNPSAWVFKGVFFILYRLGFFYRHCQCPPSCVLNGVLFMAATEREFEQAEKRVAVLREARRLRFQELDGASAWGKRRPFAYRRKSGGRARKRPQLRSPPQAGSAAAIAATSTSVISSVPIAARTAVLLPHFGHDSMPFHGAWSSKPQARHWYLAILVSSRLVGQIGQIIKPASPLSSIPGLQRRHKSNPITPSAGVGFY
jgi:hypothetical protein